MERRRPQDAVTSCWRERTRESTMFTKRQKWKRHGIAVACEPIRSFGFASCLRMVGRSLQIHELGDAESILRNKLHLRETAQRLIRRGIVPQDDGWDGWLGRYQKAIADAAIALERQGLNEGSRTQQKSRLWAVKHAASRTTE